MKRIKAVLRDGVAESLFRTGLSSPARWAPGRLAIATFHRVLPEKLLSECPMPGLAVTPDELNLLLQLFRRHFAIDSLRDAATQWEQDVDPQPRLALTFDDGQVDNFIYALPVLKQHGVHASFFVPTDAIDEGRSLWHDRLSFAVASGLQGEREPWRDWIDELGLSIDAAPSQAAQEAVAVAKHADPVQRATWVANAEALAGRNAIPEWDGMMSWDQLRELQSAGHEIGSHSCSHALLDQCTEAELESEIADSKSRIEQQLDTPVSSFCYPNGNWNSRCVNSVRAAGYEWAVSTDWGSNVSTGTRYHLQRFEMHSKYSRSANGSFSPARICWRMTGFYPGLP